MMFPRFVSLPHLQFVCPTCLLYPFCSASCEFFCFVFVSFSLHNPSLSPLASPESVCPEGERREVGWADGEEEEEEECRFFSLCKVVIILCREKDSPVSDSRGSPYCHQLNSVSLCGKPLLRAFLLNVFTPGSYASFAYYTASSS